MALAKSKITEQGEVLVPAKVREALAAGPGSVLEWDHQDGKIVVRRAESMTFAEIRKALWGNKKFKKRSLRELNEGKAAYIRKKYGHLRKSTDEGR
jgi:AbrB family looped-hinge helix DNA binding protein